MGRVSGLLEGLAEETKQDVIIDIILAEAIKTSEIEGEYPSWKDVLSSIRKNLGLHYNPEHIKDKSATGLGELMIDVRNTFKEPLTGSKLFAWHKMLLSENKNIAAGLWRTNEEPMQVISGTMGKEKVHYEATLSSNRIKKNLYYDSLEKAQRSNEITPWIEYFIKTALDAQREAETQIDFTLKKTKFFDRFKDQLNERQTIVIKRMLEEGTKGFEGGMNAKKYIAITKTSKATSTRDMQQLLELGAFVLAGKAGGRSTSYNVNL